MPNCIWDCISAKLWHIDTKLCMSHCHLTQNTPHIHYFSAILTKIILNWLQLLISAVGASWFACFCNAWPLKYLLLLLLLLGAKHQRCGGTYCIIWWSSSSSSSSSQSSSFSSSSSSSTHKFMAANRTTCRKVVKFGTQKEDSLICHHSKFGASL